MKRIYFVVIRSYKELTCYQLTNLCFSKFSKVFKNEPVTAVKRSKNLKELTGSNKIENSINKQIENKKKIENKEKLFETREKFPVF